MKSPLRWRKSEDADTSEDSLRELQEAAASPTAKKGRPTPKRKDKEVGRVGPPAPPPMTRKEAYARNRSQAKDDRGRARAGMAAGDDKYLLERDRGPVRQLIRDIVDARRGIGSWFLVIGVLIILGNGSHSSQLRNIATALWAVLIISLAVDWTLMGRKISRLVRDRFPEDQTAMRKHIFYAVIRSTQFRRLRQPAVRVKYGEQV